MLAIQPYALQDTEGAVEFLQQAMDGRERLFVQIKAAEKEMRLTHNPGRFLYARFCLLEYAAAAYATKNRASFAAAVDSLMANQLPEETGGFQPTAAQLGGDLAVALSCRRIDRVAEIAAQVLRASVVTAPEDLQAHILALLARDDYRKAAGALPRMHQAITAANLSRHEAGLLAGWTAVAAGVAARSQSSLTADLQRISQLRTVYISNMLARWRKGQSTDLTAIDFWDTHTTALMAIAANIGLVKTLAPVELPLADWRWTGNAHERGEEKPSASLDASCGLVLDEGRT